MTHPMTYHKKTLQRKSLKCICLGRVVMKRRRRDSNRKAPIGGLETIEDGPTARRR